MTCLDCSEDLTVHFSEIIPGIFGEIDAVVEIQHESLAQVLTFERLRSRGLYGDEVKTRLITFYRALMINDVESLSEISCDI